MADTKISNMTAASALTGAEELAGVQSAGNVKITATQIKTWTSASPALVTPALGTPASGTLTNCTGLPVAGGGTGAATARAATANLVTWYCLGFSGVSLPLTGTTSETILATVTIPANAMGANGIIRVHTTWSYTNSANNKILKVRFGGIGGTAYFNTTSTTTASFKHVFEMHNRGATNSQVSGTSSGSTAGIWSSSTCSITTSAVDTTAAVDLVFTGQLATAAETIALECYLVELLSAS